MNCPIVITAIRKDDSGYGIDGIDLSNTWEMESVKGGKINMLTSTQDPSHEAVVDYFYKLLNFLIFYDCR